MQLMTKAIASQLFKNDKSVIANGECSDEIVVKYFNPTGAETWYIVSGTPLDAENGDPCDVDDAKDWHLFGFADLGDAQCAELGYTLLSTLEAQECGFGLGIERDLHFGPESLVRIQAETRARA